MIPNAEDLNPAERFHPRVEANFRVKVMVNGRAYTATARDLSMAGIFLVGHVGRPGDRLTLALPLPGDREISTECGVVRLTAEGAAVEFDQLDWEDLFALARFLHPRLP